MNEEQVLKPDEGEHLIRPSVSTGAPSPQGEGKERTPEMIGAEIRMYVDAGRRVTLLCGIEIGRRLVEAKEMLNHGQWLPWLERETEFSTSSAARYMKIFEEYGAAQLGLFGPETNSPTLGNMSISNALRLLAIPENEREEFAREVDAEHLSARDLEALVKERTEELRAAKESAEAAARGAVEELREAKTAKETAENARAEAEEALRRARDELREIESRPQTVAVERDEQAIAEEVEAALQIEREHAEKEKTIAIRDAVAAEREKLDKELAGEISRAANDAADAEREKHLEAEKQAKKEIAELKEQIKKAQEEQAKTADALREAQAKADAAEKSGQDAERLQRDVETLKKQLTLADPAVKDFSAAFDRAQDELGHMNIALHEIGDEEIKGKLLKASIAMLEGFLERVKE